MNFKRVITFIFACIVMHLITKAQTSTFFTILEYNYNLEMNCVKPLFDHNYIVTGLVEAETNDIFILKIDSLGSVLWSKKIGYKDENLNRLTNDVGLKILSVHADTSFLILGSTLNSSSSILLKFSNNGTLYWQRWFNKGYNVPADLIQCNDLNGFILNGSHSEIENPLSKKPYLIRIDNNGEIVWQNEYTYSKWPESTGAFSTILNSDDNAYYAAGYIKETSGSNATMLYIAKIDESGALLWDAKLDTILDYPAHVYLVRYSENNYMLAAATKRDPNTIKAFLFSTSGIIETLFEASLPEFEFPENIINLNNSLVFSTNNVTDTSGCYFGRISENTMPYDIKPFVYSNGYNYRSKYIATASDSGLIVLAENTVPGENFKRACIIKLNQNGECFASPQIRPIDAAATRIDSKVSKTIFVHQANINELEISSLDFNFVTRYSIVDQSGKYIQTSTLAHSTFARVPINTLKRGVYLLRITNGKQQASFRFLR